MDSFVRDLRYVTRALLRTPGFFIVTVLTLALGIGATTAIFSVISGVLLRPLPYAHADRIVQIWQVGTKGGQMNFSDANFADLGARSRSLAAMAEVSGPGMVSVSGATEPARVRATAVSRGFFSIFGVPPLRGRTFLPEEQQLGGAPAVIVSDGFWQTHMGGGADALGKTLTFEDRTYTVVGVMPPTMDYPVGTDLWVPRELDPVYPSRTAHNFEVVALLAPGTSLARAQSEITTLARQMKAQYGETTAMADAQLVPLREQLVGEVRPALLVLLAASAFLLLIACANVVNLLVARMAARQSEIALRLALGAGRRRLAQQFLTESLVLSLAAAIIGVLLAVAGLRALLAIEPGKLPRAGEVRLDWRVLAFTLLVAAVTATAIGLIAAWRGTRGELRDALAASQRTQAGGASYQIRGTLVVAQVALTLVLLVAVGLLGRSFVRLLSVDPGFRTEHVVVADLSAPSAGDSLGRLRTIRLYDDVLARLRAIPTVRDAGGINTLPFSNDARADGTFLVMSRPDEPLSMNDFERLFRDTSRTAHADFRVASTGYFRAMEIPLLEGRTFTAGDTRNAPHVAVISASLAQERWPGQTAIGKVIQFGNMDGDLHPFTVIGIVGDVHDRGFASQPRPTFYANVAQRPGHAQHFNFVMRVAGDPTSVIAAARSAIHQVSPDVPPRFRTMQTVVSDSVADRRFILLLLGVFGGAALLLATLGVYSVISYLVAQRRHEIGIRVALGARTADVLRLVLGQGAVLALIGVALGTVAALWLTRLLGGLLYGVGATDPLSFIAVIVLLTTVALLASLIPARRASKVDPMTALRE